MGPRSTSLAKSPRLLDEPHLPNKWRPVAPRGARSKRGVGAVADALAERGVGAVAAPRANVLEEFMKQSKRALSRRLPARQSC